ncbi:MAG: response regulator [Burkholderiaceae bacterium]|nr:response regulator [Burkholderiaceae bacterium]MCD8515806.1 response regulator [Burkholderiaceae bacterium]MCD8536036.1 response regulator [Burkholderiaceae bacterium]MCD8564140.1 response regulator [Burkholderiaceae bacterium]
MARILVVDDEVGIRELLFEILYDEGHTVELAENAAQARAARQRMRPDLVLLDIWMPDTDGVTLLREWGSQGLLDMPVIMMSGHATVDTAVEATRIGAVDFLEKPITLQRLLKTIHNGLARDKPIAVPQVAGKPVLSNQVSAPSTVPASAEPPEPEPIDTAPEQKPGLSGNISLDQPLREARDEFERVYFEYHLARENNSMTRVSERTGLERTHLYRKLKQLGIEARKRSS